jgi:cell division protein FtsB
MIVSKSRQNSDSHNFFFSRSFVFLCFILIFFLVVAYLQESKKQNKVDQRINELRQEAKKVEESNLSLSKILSYTESEQYAELQARQMLNYKKPGEGVIVINRGNENQNQEIEDTRSNLEKWVEFVFTHE